MAGTVRLVQVAGHWLLHFAGRRSGNWPSPDLAARAVARHRSGLAVWDRRRGDAPEDLLRLAAARRVAVAAAALQTNCHWRSHSDPALMCQKTGASMAQSGRELLAALGDLRRSIMAEAAERAARWREQIELGSFVASAENLAHYLALRHHDLRDLQRELMRHGLSSLGRLESRVMVTLQTVESGLAAMLSDTRRSRAGHRPASGSSVARRSCRRTPAPCWAARRKTAVSW